MTEEELPPVEEQINSDEISIGTIKKYGKKRQKSKEEKDLKMDSIVSDKWYGTGLRKRSK